MIVIVDYGAGNLVSIRNMLRRLGHDCTISGKAEEIMKAERLILPGVGHFDYGMGQLRNSGLVDVLRRRVLDEGTALLGICLGAQLLTKRSDEGDEPGLGWFDAETVAFDSARLTSRLRIPHMGWADVKTERETRLFADLPAQPRFYFVHKYHMTCRNPADAIVTARHGYRFVAGIERGNIAGVQFHPEKSHKFGMQLLDNFVKHF
jgi:imidazole glycerol-phosphate synthase subunit HisH